MKPIFRILGILIAVALVLLCVLYVVVPLVLLSYEDDILKDELNNPYINSGFENWKNVSLSENVRFRIPEEWNIQEESGSWTISNTEGNEIAQCVVFGPKDGDSDDLTNYLANIYGENTTAVYENLPDYSSFQGTDFNKLIIKSETNEPAYYCLQLGHVLEARSIVLFPAESELSYDYLLEVAEAIAYSFVYS